MMTDEDEELSEEYRDVSCTGASADSLDSPSSDTVTRGERGKKITAEMKEQIRRELLGDPGGEITPAVQRVQGKRHSAVSSHDRRVVKLGSTISSTMARNLPSDVFSKSKDSGELLEILRERKKSRESLVKAHTLAEANMKKSDVIITTDDMDMSRALKSAHALVTEGDEVASPPKLDRSLPTLKLNHHDNSDEEEEDIISKLVLKTSLLSAPQRSSRKVSLQEELCGKGSPQTRGPMRASVAGDIIKSADSSPLNTEPISPSHPYRGLPTMPGLIIPDKWKSDLPPSSHNEDDGTDSLSSDVSSDLETDDDIPIALTFETSRTLGTASTDSAIRSAPAPHAGIVPDDDEIGSAKFEPRVNPDIHRLAFISSESKSGIIVNASSAESEKEVSDSRREKTAERDSECTVAGRRIKRRQSSSERSRRRSQPDIQFPIDSDDDEPPTPIGKQEIILEQNRQIFQKKGNSIHSSLTLAPRHKASTGVNKTRRSGTVSPDKLSSDLSSTDLEVIVMSASSDESCTADLASHHGEGKPDQAVDYSEVTLLQGVTRDDTQMSRDKELVAMATLEVTMESSAVIPSCDHDQSSLTGVGEGRGEDQRSHATEKSGSFLPDSDHMGEVVEVGVDGTIRKKQRSKFKYTDATQTTPIRAEKEVSEDDLRCQIREMQEEMAKSDLIIAELNITIEDLREYNTKLENDMIQSTDGHGSNNAADKDIPNSASCDQERQQSLQGGADNMSEVQSDEWLNLEIEVARLQKEVADRDTIIRTQRDALDKAMSKGGTSTRQISLAGAAKQALDINVSDMARKYNESLRLCKEDGGMGEEDRERYEDRLTQLEKRHYELVEQLGVRHTEEMETLRADYEVLLELAVKEKESEMRDTIIENEEMEDLAAQVDELSMKVAGQEKELEERDRHIASLLDEIRILKDNKPPSPIPQIVIEDPDGQPQCDGCLQKSQQIATLQDSVARNEDVCVELCTQTKQVINAAQEESSELRNDVTALKSEFDHFTLEVRGVIQSYADTMLASSQVTTPISAASVACQTIVTHKPRVLPTPTKEGSEYSAAHSVDSTWNGGAHEHGLQCCRSAQTSLTNLATEVAAEQAEHFRRKEEGYKRDLFDLRVKLKELEAKMIHLKRKAEEIKGNMPVEIPPEGLSNEKLLEMVQDRENTLQQVRRLHGQNLATMRRRHDKVVSSLQSTIDQLESSLQQLVPSAWYSTSPLNGVEKPTADNISASCRQGRFSACAVIADDLSQH